MKKSKTSGLCLVAVSALAISMSHASAETFNGNSLSVQDFTGTVEILTTSGDEIDVNISQGSVYSRVDVRQTDGVVYIVGEQWTEDDDLDCCDRRITRQFNARRDREVSAGKSVDGEFFEQYPTATISIPVDSDVEFIDARMNFTMERLDGSLELDSCYVYGQTSDIDDAVIGIVDGSQLVIGDIAGALEVDVSGDANLLAGDATMVDIDVAGPGDVVLGEIDGMLDVSIAGSGLVRSTYVDGPVTVRIAGSGALAVKDGNADRLRANIDGSGGVYFNGRVSQPDLRLYGSSEVRMQSVRGRVKHHGGGDVYVGDEVFDSDN